MARSKDFLPDWFVGGAGKRRVLDELLRGNLDRSWTQYELAKECGLHPKRSVERHVAVLVQSGLLLTEGHRVKVNRVHPMVRPLVQLLQALDSQLPNDPLPPSRGGL